MTEYVTKFGSLADYDKGNIDLINDQAKNYAFSNIFEVANSSKPWEKVAVGKNMQYVLEAIRAEGTSEWRTCAHDEFPLCMDGEVTIELVKLDTPAVPADKEGSVRIDGEPVGKKMGRIVLRKGHQALLPANAAYRMSASAPSVILLQTILGDDTVERWADICLELKGEDTDMTMTDVQSTEPNAQGYREFSLGAFHFSRDEYFVHITWPTGKHVLSADVFLRALQRDVAWDFFYGTVNFDSVFGTVNHYGTVDMFAGRFNDAYRKAELDHTENFETPLIRDTFKAMLDDWTNASFDPFASPAETDKPFGVKDGSNTEAITRRRVAANRMVSVPGDEQIRTDETHPVNRMFADVPQDEPEVYPEPGFEDEVAAPTTCTPTSAAATSRGTPASSACARPACTARPARSTCCRCSTATTASNGSCSSATRSCGTCRIATPARRAAKVTMKAGDVAAMPGDIRHQGYSPKRSMLLVWENASPELPEMIRTGKASVYPVEF